MSTWGNGARRAQESQFAELALPNLLQRVSFVHRGKVRAGAGTMRGDKKWKQLAQQLRAMERQLHAWEVANPEAYKALPWYEAREEFKAQLERGEVIWPSWWELAGAVNKIKLVTNRMSL